jgi:hypothetical protein
MGWGGWVRRLTVLPCVLLFLAMPGPASALTADEAHTGGEIVNGGPEAVVVVGRSGTVGEWSGSPRGGPRWRCGYYGFDLDAPDSDGTLAVVRYDLGPVDPEVDGLYVMACFDQSGRQVRSLLQQYDPADPLGGVAATERALDEARRRLDLPLPEPALNPPGAQLVGVPTWMWVEGPWEPTSASAAVGSVAATVTARPVEVVWDTGDGTTTTCDAGTPYDPTRAPDAQHSSCTHVFTHASAGLPGGAHSVTATVTYEVSWSATTGGAGDLGTLSRSTTVPVPVAEAQALIR